MINYLPLISISLKNQCIINKIKIDIKQYGKDILNQFYSEFCIWDRNNDGKLGIVLTPDDIVNNASDGVSDVKESNNEVISEVNNDTKEEKEDNKDVDNNDKDIEDEEITLSPVKMD